MRIDSYRVSKKKQKKKYLMKEYYFKMYKILTNYYKQNLRKEGNLIPFTSNFSDRLLDIKQVSVMTKLW